VKLLVQPDDCVFPLIKALQQAKRTIDMHVFRLQYKAIEKAIEAAVARGVEVRTLIAHTNKGGDRALRKLEQRLLAIGATVSRTADDLLRYHGKIMVVDGATLYVLGFNFIHQDIDHSRSLGIVTRKRELVQEAVKLFEADFNRHPYKGESANLIVSPVNARERLADFLKGARKQLLIYDGQLTDNAMIRILKDRVEAGVELRVIGKVEKGHGLAAEPFPGPRQHLRAIVRDGKAVFLGSQSLRKLELDARREIGIVVKNAEVVRQVVDIFEKDWGRTGEGVKEARRAKREQAREEAKAEARA
jgi:phosphatidylserine/phosphatidylglycerophosphate/cardiolipin synthase-like enzyme